MTKAPQSPVTIEDDGEIDVARAAAPEDTAEEHDPAAPPAVRSPRGSRIWGWGSRLIVTGLSFWTVLLAERFAQYWLDRSPIIGSIVVGFLVLFAVMAILAILREVGALRRLARTQALKSRLTSATTAKEARTLLAPVIKRATRTPAMGPQIAAYHAATQEAMDAVDITRRFEMHILKDQDAQARAIIEHAARQVATITTLVPIALTDMLAVTWINLRMIRRINETYGGGSAVLSNFKILRGIFANLMAAGLMDISDDLLGTLVGHGALSKLSRRFGEGAVNGALTARIGLRAQALCRPLEFDVHPQPSLRTILSAAFTGLFRQTRK